MAKKILLADDSMTIQKVVELTFMDQDYEVEAVSDGASAIAKIGETQPDVIVADVHMPGADGYEVCAKWKASAPTTPVLLLVGTFEQFDEQKAAQAGADDHLKKPFDSQELLQKVQALVSGGGSAPPALAAAPPELSTQPAPVPQPPAAPEAPAPPAPAAPATPEPAGAEAFATQATRAPEPPPAAPEPVAPPAVETVAVPEVQPADPEPVPAEPVQTESQTPEEMRPSTAETRPRRAEPSASEEAAPGPAPAQTASANGSLSDEDVERIARKVVELAGATAVKEVAWEILPDLAEVVIRERIQELESGVD